MDTRATGPHLSVVVPVFNEEKGLPTFFDALCAVLDRCDVEAEVVFVNDGSQDNTSAVLARLQEQDRRVVVVDLSRNFGHQAALTAGLDVAQGDAVLTMDADLEHPPECIPEFLEKWRAGAEIVFGRRTGEDHVGWFKATTSKLFYRLFRAMANVDLAGASPDFRLMDRRAADALRSMRERSRFLRGMARWVGFRHATVEFSPGQRSAGTTGYSLAKMIRFSVDGLLSFSKVPIRMTTLLGMMVSLVAFLYAGYALYEHLVLGQTVPGWTSTVVVLSLLSGVQLLALGLMGEYVGQVYDEVKRRPIYIARAVVRPPTQAPAGRRDPSGPPPALDAPGPG